MRRLWAFLTLTVLICSCSEHTDKHPRVPETSGTLSTNEATATQAELRVPTAAEVQALLARQDRIAQQPQDAALRRELGQKALDMNAGVVWSVGRAKLPSTSASSHIAQSQAELAARVDASRWAAYLIEWQRNDYATAFGSVHTNIPGGEVVSKSVTDSTCLVLLKTSLR